MNKTSGNAIRLKLTNLQSAWKTLQIKARDKVRRSWNQDCGAETQISGSGSSSGIKIFSLRLQNDLVH